MRMVTAYKITFQDITRKCQLKLENTHKNLSKNDQVRGDKFSPSKPPTSSQNTSLVFDNVFIVTYGRSGSTLLQGLLNTIDGVLVRGENGNFIFNLFEAYEALSNAMRPRQKNRKDSTHPWFGIDEINEDTFINNLRQTVLRTLLSDHSGDGNITCIGFKEIRYPAIGEKLKPYLDFLSILFPKSAFIFLTRDLDQVALSSWWGKEDPKWVHAYLRAFELRVTMYAQKKPNCYMISYKDIIEMNHNLREMYTFLGAPYRDSDVRRTILTPHSYRSGPKC